MNRYGAFLIHLGISLLVFAALAGLVVYVWYPDFFFLSDGGWQGMRLIAIVDLVLGPLLTLVVFDPVKKSRRQLRIDLGTIGVVQAACLIAGTYVVYSERPLALVYVDGQFFSMSADSYREIGATVPDLSRLPGPYPKHAVVRMPDDFAEIAQVRGAAWREGVPLRALSERYTPFDFAALDAAREALPRERLEAREAETGDLRHWLQVHGGTLDDYAFFPFGARYDYLVMGVSRTEQRVVGVLRTPLT